MKPLLVGEDNPYSRDPRYALYPAPSNSAGNRLCVKILGYGKVQYLRTFDRVNLCAGKWSMREAREHARHIAGRYHDGSGALILLGAKVAEAFGYVYAPFVRLGSQDRMPAILLLPHPSGRSRAWNDANAIPKVRALVQRLLRDAQAHSGGTIETVAESSPTTVPATS